MEVISGRYKKSQGKVLKVFRKRNQVLVQGVNMKFKQVRDDEMVERVKTVQQEHPVHVSNVALIDPELNVPTRIKYGYLEDGTKVRVSKKSGSIIAKPDRSNLAYQMRVKDVKNGPLDTLPEAVLKKTYTGEDFFQVYQDFENYLNEKAEIERHLVFDEDHLNDK